MLDFSFIPFDVTGFSVVGISAGALADTSFEVVADISGAAPTKLVVTTAADTGFATPVFTSPTYVAPTVTDKSSGTFNTVRHSATGLSANTAYRYALKGPDGIQTLTVGTIKTAPVTGTPAAFSFMFGACSTWNPGQVSNVEVPVAMAAETDALFFMHIGDMGYDDYIGTDVKVKRSYTIRLWNSVPAAQALNLAKPLVYMYDDHDAAADDYHWDAAPPGTTYADIMVRLRQVYREGVPHYPFLQVTRGEGDISDPIPTQVFDIANCRFILMDTRAQRRYAVGTPTVLGRTSGHELWNQYNAVIAACQGAASAGRGLIFLISPSNWDAAYDGWGDHAGWVTEQIALLDAIKAIPSVPPVVVLVGNSHACAADDGTNTDKSTGGGMKIIQFMCSPFFQTALANGYPYSWDGAGSLHTGNDRIYAKVDVNAANTGVVVTFKGRAGAGTISTIATYNTADLAGW